jgi:predicted restriction endonuclease
MYSAALNLFQRFLQDESQSEIDADIQQLQDVELDTTVRESLVNARKGQGLFRARVLAQWHNRCAVTGYSDTRFICASHIKPWRASDDRERLDRFNGLPLIPSIDKAFDIGFVSFNAFGNILISDQLELPEKLGIYPNQKIQIAKYHQAYLEFHRAELFKG